MKRLYWGEMKSLLSSCNSWTLLISYSLKPPTSYWRWSTSNPCTSTWMRRPKREGEDQRHWIPSRSRIIQPWWPSVTSSSAPWEGTAARSPVRIPARRKFRIWDQLIEASAIANLTTIKRSGISSYATEVPDSYIENVCHTYLHLYYLVQTLTIKRVGTWSFWISLMCLSWLYQRHLNSEQRRMNPQKFLA